MSLNFVRKMEKEWRYRLIKTVDCLNHDLLLIAKLNTYALLHGCFLRFLNCANGTKSRNASHMVLALSLSHDIY